LPAPARGGVRIVLVTHFMDEAEQLCDRLAIIDRGRVVALDTPEGLVRRASDEMRVRFRSSSPVDEAQLLALPAVDDVEKRNGEVVVRGRGDLLPELMRHLDQAGVTATELRVEQSTLDDAFVALTGRAPAEEAGGR
jgi:ABC-2 type transport system ATP-binding protein